MQKGCRQDLRNGQTQRTNNTELDRTENRKAIIEKRQSQSDKEGIFALTCARARSKRNDLVVVMGVNTRMNMQCMMHACTPPYLSLSLSLIYLLHVHQPDHSVVIKKFVVMISAIFFVMFACLCLFLFLFFFSSYPLPRLFTPFCHRSFLPSFLLFLVYQAHSHLACLIPTFLFLLVASLLLLLDSACHFQLHLKLNPIFPFLTPCTFQRL